jgi:prepilin-type N-terminal cleavage/methylation domain-containing protein/prepilin-type processing-associated H-X9-DG protein
MNRKQAAFTLIELLVVVAIISVLAILLFVVAPSAILRGKETASLNNMRQVGAGFHMYATDYDQRLPNRTNSGDRWPRLLQPYLQGTKVYADPADPTNFLLQKKDPLANNPNNTSYMMNGFNDMGAYDDDTVTVRVNNVDAPSQTILLCPAKGHANFYMDFQEGNQTDVIDKVLYDGGSNYLFVDGSVQFIKKKDYDRGGYGDNLWLVHKDSQIP